MRTRRLKNGLELTELGIGVAQFGNLYVETTDEESVAAIDAAWEGGVRYFDTAPHYGLGLSERRLGLALAERARDEYVLSTKVGQREWDFSRSGILRSLEQSLERLNTDRIDIVYLHDPDSHWEQASSEGISALIELREQGVVKAIGIGMNQSTMLAEFVRRYDIDVVMLANRFTLLEQSPLDDLMPLAEERGVGVVAAAVYNSGLLSARKVASNANYNYAPAPPELIARANAIAEVCDRHGVTLPDAAIAYPLRHRAVVSVVLGTRSSRQVRSNLARYAAPAPERLWAELSDIGLVRPIP